MGMERILQFYEKGLSGKMGDIVYYQRRGKTHIRKVPAKPSKPGTPKQTANRERFATAQRFAATVIADPALKAMYKQKAGGRCTAYAMAISEWLKTS
jgi:hypothetical protein